MIFLFRSLQYWVRTSPASMVLPKPTSSAKITPLDSGDLKANKAASTWWGFKSIWALNIDWDNLSIELALFWSVNKWA